MALDAAWAAAEFVQTTAANFDSPSESLLTTAYAVCWIASFDSLVARMADNIEEFLRRAAERRQAKAAQATKPAPATASPEYTHSRTARLPTAELVEDAPLPAILVESPEQGMSVPQHLLMHQVERARVQQARKEKKGEGTVKPVGPPAAMITAAEISNPTSLATDQANIENPVQQLMEWMKRPGGLTQAIIMNEILARPDDRW